MAIGRKGKEKMDKHAEIGSIYEINPGLFVGEYMVSAQSLRLREVEKYNKKNIRYTASGREAIALALESFIKKHPDALKRCLLPAYMCDTVFFPFERAGWEIHFYHLDRKMRADIEEMDRLIRQVNPEIIFIHPYYGVDTWEDIRPFFSEWKAQGIYIMEDVSQSYYLEGIGKEVDYLVGSLRKWYAVPDGGFVASDEELLGEGLVPNREFTDKRRELLTEKWVYLHEKRGTEEGRALKADYLKKNRIMEDWLDAYGGIGAVSEESAFILAQSDEQECKNRRRINCAYLHKQLTGRTQIAPVFGEEYEGEYKSSQDGAKDTGIQKAAPLYYPIYAKRRDELEKFLADHDVYAPTLWLVGQENANCLSEEERYIYGHILALPIDQRYGIREMRRVVEVLDQYENLGNLNIHGKKFTIGIRVDANETIATGHVMRCITIARQLIMLGERVLFFTADGYAGDLLKQAGMESICLNTAWDRMEEETDLLRVKLQETGCKKLLVDSYQVTGKYFEALRDACKLIYIDDCFEAVYPVDLLINYNAYYVRFPYEKAYGDKARLLLGTIYVPLREEFGEGKYKRADGSDALCRNKECPGPYGNQREHPGIAGDYGIGKDIAYPHVLVSSGGGDTCNALPGILDTAARGGLFHQAVFHVVVGGFNRNVETLEHMAKECPNIRLHYRVDHMAQLMGKCTAAVSAAGTMLFELSAMQIPTVFFVSADNQQYDSEFFAKEDRMLFAGDIRKNREECLGRICGQLQVLLGDVGLRKRMGKKLLEVTDGKGAKRIAEAIVRL